MSWPLFGIISIIGIIFLRIFHKQIAASNYSVTAVYLNSHLYKIKTDKKILQAFLTAKQDSSHLSELLTALGVLSTDSSLFPSEQSYVAAEKFVSSFALNRTKLEAKQISKLAFNEHRSFGGIEILQDNGDVTVYVIGHTAKILKMAKNVLDKEEIIRLSEKYQAQSGTSMAVATYESQSGNRNILQDGFSSKIDFIGCLFVAVGA